MKRLAIWRDERLDLHVTQEQSTWFLFLSAHKHLCFCRLAQGFKLCCPMKYFLILLNRRKCSLQNVDGDLSDSTSERDSERDNQH